MKEPLSDLYDWQLKDYHALVRTSLLNPHALLIIGKEGLGVVKLVATLISFLLCLNPNGNYPCGCCKSCELIANSTHPDWYNLTANIVENKKTCQITTEQVRGMINYLNVFPHLASKKIILIENTSELSLNTSNALLKIVEEPPAYALIILISYNLGEVLPTLKSRCHKYSIFPPSQFGMVKTQENANSNSYREEFWLHFYDNCPLSTPPIEERCFENLINIFCMPTIDNIFLLIGEIETKSLTFEFFIEFAIKWLSDMLSFKFSGILSYFEEWNKNILILIPRLKSEEAFLLVDKLCFLAKWAKHPLNYKLQATNLLFQYQNLFS